VAHALIDGVDTSEATAAPGVPRTSTSTPTMASSKWPTSSPAPRWPPTGSATWAT
jgi:hypothetical protein